MVSTFSYFLFTQTIGGSSMNLNVLENPWAAIAVVAILFVGYYALAYFIVVVLMKQGVPGINPNGPG